MTISASSTPGAGLPSWQVPRRRPTPRTLTRRIDSPPLSTTFSARLKLRIEVFFAGCADALAVESAEDGGAPLLTPPSATTSATTATVTAAGPDQRSNMGPSYRDDQHTTNPAHSIGEGLTRGAEDRLASVGSACVGIRPASRRRHIQPPALILQRTCLVAVPTVAATLGDRQTPGKWQKSRPTRRQSPSRSPRQVMAAAQETICHAALITAHRCQLVIQDAARHQIGSPLDAVGPPDLPYEVVTPPPLVVTRDVRVGCVGHPPVT